MKFEGHLTIEREHIVERIRFALPARLERDDFMVIAAEPLRARHRLGWFQRWRRAMRVGGGGKLVRQARELRFALPLSGTGSIDYVFEIPNLGRIGAMTVGAAGGVAWFQENLATAIFVTFFMGAGMAIGLHWLIRKSVLAYLGLAPGQFAEHRLTMG